MKHLLDMLREGTERQYNHNQQVLVYELHFNIKEIKTPYVVKISSSFKSENNLKYWSFIRLSVATDKPVE